METAKLWTPFFQLFSNRGLLWVHLEQDYDDRITLKEFNALFQGYRPDIDLGLEFPLTQGEYDRNVEELYMYVTGSGGHGDEDEPGYFNEEEPEPHDEL